MQICAQTELGVTCNAWVAGQAYSARNSAKQIETMLTGGKRQRLWAPCEIRTAYGIDCMPPNQPQPWNVTGLRGHRREMDDAQARGLVRAKNLARSITRTLRGDGPCHIIYRRGEKTTASG
jgi:hypothetical protein